MRSRPPREIPAASDTPVAIRPGLPCRFQARQSRKGLICHRSLIKGTTDSRHELKWTACRVEIRVGDRRPPATVGHGADAAKAAASQLGRKAGTRPQRLPVEVVQEEHNASPLGTYLRLEDSAGRCRDRRLLPRPARVLSVMRQHDDPFRRPITQGAILGSITDATRALAIDRARLTRYLPQLRPAAAELVASSGRRCWSASG